MKLENRIAYNLKVVVDDYITNKKFGFILKQEDYELSHNLELNIDEFEDLYIAVCHMKELIEKERIKDDIKTNTRID